VLRAGAVALAVGSPGLLVACSGGNDTPEGGDGPPSPATVGDADLAVLRTVTSIELLLVEAYDRIADRRRPDLGAPTRALFDRFADHHRDHAESLRAAAVAAGGVAHDAPNDALRDRLLAPGLEAATSRVSVLSFARGLEQFAAAADVHHVSALVAPELRRTVLAVGGAEARHVAAVRGLLGAVLAPDAFVDTALALPDDYALD
jgi:hypothetical protein